MSTRLFVTLSLFLAPVVANAADQCDSIQRIVGAFDADPARLRGQQTETIDGTHFYEPTIPLTGLGDCSIAVSEDSPDGRYTCSEGTKGSDSSAFSSIMDEVRSCSLHFRGDVHSENYERARTNSSAVIVEVVSGRTVVIIELRTMTFKSSGRVRRTFNIEKK